MEKLRPIDRFWKLLKPDAKEIRNIYLYSIFNGLVNLSLPLGIQAIVNLIQAGSINSAWKMLIVFVVLGIILSGIMTIFQLRITETLQQRIFARASFELVYRVPKMKLESLYKHYAPELMNRFFDVLGVQKGLSKILIDISAAGLQVIFGLLLLSVYHPFFIVFSIGLVVLIYLIFRLTFKKGMKTSLAESKNKYKVAHWLEEVARVSSSFKMAGTNDLPLERMNKYVQNYVDTREAHFKILRSQYFMLVAFKAIVALGLLAIGGILVMNQILNIGQFVAAEIIILLIITSVEKLVMSLETIYDVLTSLEKVGQVMDMELEKSDGYVLEKSPDGNGIHIETQELSFRYPESKREVLKNLSVEIKNKESVLISGTNGSGKSTFIHLLAALYDIDDGSILLNGMDQSSYDRNSLRRNIGGCLSEGEIFEGTLFENISMNREGIGLQEVEWSLQKVGLNKWIKTLPLGYYNPLDPLGNRLSRSIIQRLLIARAIVDKPCLLLIEYAMDSIDFEDRKEIVDFILDKSNPWTLITVSNDEYLAKNVDKIILMNDGHVEHIGKYEMLKNFFKFKKRDDV